MDLLFKRYASPFSFVNEMIKTGRFCEFIDSFIKTTLEEKEEQFSWEFWLHKVFEGTYNDFKEQIKTNSQNISMPKEKIEATVHNSLDILKTFKPNEQGGEE